MPFNYTSPVERIAVVQYDLLEPDQAALTHSIVQLMYLSLEDSTLLP